MSDDRAYRVWVGFDPEKERYWARVPELGAEAEGESRADAIGAVEKQIEAAVERAAVSGEKAPAPSDLSLLGGSITLALAPTLQRDLEFQAKLARLTPEALAAQLLARGLGNEAPRRAPPAPAQRPAAADETINDRPRGDRDGNDRGPPRRRDGGGAGGGGNRGRREGYRPEMENQADFLAYVRDQEKGRGGGGGGGGGGRGGNR